MIISYSNSTKTDYGKIRESKAWNKESSTELKMHKIHVYPAKFPAFLINKTLGYARRKNIPINTMGDIFCGCGTSALEAKKNGIDFWGCDINPVATLITKVKTEKYKTDVLEKYYYLILENYNENMQSIPIELSNNDRINYWFEKEQTKKLYTLLYYINNLIPKGKYQNFFHVAFSNILKGSSRWLTKSIKPTIDQKKETKNILFLFRAQFNSMIKAVAEYNKKVNNLSNTTIINKNFLRTKPSAPFLDLLITSPPYVTSYEYADLHQLSTLWLNYTNDFRTLRNGTIGSVYHQNFSAENIDINDVGNGIYKSLVKAKGVKAKPIAKYFLDIKKSVEKAYSIVNPGGLAVFVIGNTKYKNVYVDNAKYMTTCLYESGFDEVEVLKRRISSKILSPYRNKDGKFSSDKRKRKVYSYEFILIAKKQTDV
jgi:methylase of polypeptide subunit release factors